MKRYSRTMVSIVTILLAMLWARALFAEGPTKSPEDPSAVLAVVGGSAAAAPYLLGRLRNYLKTKKRPR
jgi:hypothetical protein